MCPLTTNRALQCVPLLYQHHLPNPGCCNMFSSPLKKLQMLRCVLLPTLNFVICGLPLSGCYDTILRLRMMLCVLRHARVAAQAAIDKQVDQHSPPHPEDAVNASEESAHHPTHPVGLSVPEDAATMCSPQPTGCHVTYHTVMCLLCLSLSQDAMMCPPPTLGCCDDASAQPSVCCCYVFSLSHRMLQWMVLSNSQVAAEQAVTVQKVDQLAPSRAEDVHAEAEAVHHHPPQVYHNLHGGDDVCDRLQVIDEHGVKVIVSVFLLSHIQEVFPQQFLPSLFYLDKHPPPPTPCPMTLLHIPRLSLPIVVRATTPVWSLYEDTQAVRVQLPGHPGRAVQRSVCQQCLSSVAGDRESEPG